MTDDLAPVVLPAHRWTYVVQIVAPLLLLLGAGPDGGVWLGLSLTLVVAAVTVASVQWRRGGSVLDRRGIRPAGWLFRTIRWAHVEDVRARGGLRSTGQVELTVQGRLRPVRLAGTQREDARVVRDYRRVALTSR